LVIGALSHVVVLGKKDRDEYVQKRDMVATKMTPAQIAEAQGVMLPSSIRRCGPRQQWHWRDQAALGNRRYRRCD
jgi:hypothetical protein